MATYSSGWSGYDTQGQPGVRFKIDFTGSISGTTFSGTVKAYAQMQSSGSYWGEAWTWTLYKGSNTSGTWLASGSWGSSHSGQTEYTSTANVSVSGLPAAGGNTSFYITLSAASPPGRAAGLSVNFGNLITNPTINSASVTNSSPGTVSYSASVTKGSGNITSGSYAWTGFGSTYSGSSGTIYNLAHNRTYNWTLKVTASDGGSATKTGSITTDHNAPNLANYYYTEERYGNYYTGTLAYDVNYDGAGFNTHSLQYGTSTAYGRYASEAGSGSRASWTLNNLEPNTTYYYKITETDNGNPNKTNTYESSFTTGGLAPVITVTETVGEHNALLAWSVVYDSASLSSCTLEYGTDTNYGTSVTPSGDSYNITWLGGAMTYYYKLTIVDNFGHTGVQTGSFTTLTYTPRDMGAYVIDVRPTQVYGIIYGDYPQGDPPTDAKIYCKLTSAAYYTAYDLQSPPGEWWTHITSLNPDTDYNLYGSYTNSQGTGYSPVITFSTSLETPTLTVEALALSAKRIQITAIATLSMNRTMQYRFSCDGGTTWTSYQSSPVYVFSNLEEHTTYDLAVEVNVVHTATYSGDIAVIAHTTCSTLFEQAKAYINDNGIWKEGITYIKTNGTWKKGKKTYIKKDGEWVPCRVR